jgi:ETFB lysine methyltransferase
MASDVMYESQHPAELGRFVDAHLHSGGEVVVVDPGRGGQGRLAREMARLGLHPTQAMEGPGRPRILRYTP